MIAPARVAAYEILMAVSSGRDLSSAIASARTGLRDDRDVLRPGDRNRRYSGDGTRSRHRWRRRPADRG
jgi:hypothetical protein